MKYVIVATLKRGPLETPEVLDDLNSLRMENSDLTFARLRKNVRRERDPFLTPREWSQEEAARAAYVRRKLRA